MEARLQTDLPQVTKRQLEVARLISRGLNNDAIAAELGISLAGAKYHVSELLSRLNLTSRDEIAAWYHARDNRGALRRFAFAPVGWAIAATGTAVAVGAAAVAISLGAAAGPSDAPAPPAATEAATEVAVVVATGDGAFLPVPAPQSRVRSRYSATTLDDGRVLLAGGIGPGSSDPAELYDPATDSFEPTGSLLGSRSSHVAVLLDDGRVLLIGGINLGPRLLQSTEIWDPATGEFERGASMSEGRTSHGAVRLVDGRVLVSGGTTSIELNDQGRLPDPIPTAQLYDPLTDEFTATGSMNIARRDHRLTLLADTRVLVSGGGPLELYDPATGEFTLFGGEPVFGTRANVATLLFDGRILITGVYTDPADSEFGRSENARGAYIVDPSSSAVVPVGPMQTGRDYYHTATLLPDGRVLITGGASGHGNPSAYPPAEIFDPAVGTFEPVSYVDDPAVPGGLRATNLATHRAGHTANYLPDGSVLLIGYVAGDLLDWSIERFDPLAADGEDRLGALIAAYVPTPTPTPGAVLNAGSTLFYGSTGEPYSFDALVVTATTAGFQIRELPGGFGGCSGGRGLGASRLRIERPDGSQPQDFMLWVYPTVEKLDELWVTEESGRVNMRSGTHCAESLDRGRFMDHTGAAAYINGNLLLLFGMPDPDFNARNPETRALLIETFEAIGTSEQ